jgi:O-antigen ligase
MIPAWVLSAAIVVLACIAALWIGSTLPDFSPDFAFELIALVVACTLCAASNNFPLLLAVGNWTPFSPGLPGYRSFPAIGIILIWMVLVLALRMSLTGTTSYRRSFSWTLVLIFAWVPVRFLMNPIHKLGSGSGGAGVSGVAPYFAYVLAGGLVIFLGAVLTDRQKIIQYFRWCFPIVLVVGVGLSICAFVPATEPFLVAMGSFAAGDIGDNIQRLVQLPGYGFFLVEVALCPSLFRLKWWQCLIVFGLGIFMIVLGGNRSALAVVPLAVPVILFLRRQSHALIVSLCAMVAIVGLVRITISNMDEADIPPLMRSFGIFDQKIDDASGGNASAQWRYSVWQSGLEKIAEAPLAGRGYGNLPEHLNAEQGMSSTDYETVLAAGLAHNGFISAAYGFGVPFAVALCVMIVWLFIKESIAALRTDKHDPVLRDLHALLAGMFISYPLFIYTAFDLSVTALWVYAAISYILGNIPKAEIYPGTAGSPLRRYGEETHAAAYTSRPY